MKKIMSTILSLTIILGLVTPASATETLVINNESEESINLEDIVDTDNVQVEDDNKVSDEENQDYEEISDTVEDETVESSDETDIPINDGENSYEEFLDKDEETTEIPSYTIDDEMESYLEEYVNSLSQEESDLASKEEQSLEGSQEELEDGMYTADFAAYKTDTETSSSMEKYISKDESRIKIKDGKIIVQLVINDSTMVVSTSASVNGKPVNVKRTDIDDTSYMVEFKLDSIKDKINITVDCNYDAIIQGMGIKTHDFDLAISNFKYQGELPVEEEKLEDGKYSIDFTSNGTKHIKTSYLEVKDGKMNVSITFSSGSYIAITDVKVNDNSITDYNLSEVINDTLTLKIPVDSIEDNINILMTITVPSINMVHSYDISVADISVVGNYVESGDDSSSDTDGDNQDDNTSEDNNKTLSDGTYTIESAFLKANSTSTSAASNYLDSKSTLTVKDGKYTLTLNVTQYITAFSNLSATVDGVTTKDVVFVKNSDGSGTISFAINSLNSSISVGCTLTIADINYVNTTEFTVKLDSSTLKNENGDYVEAPEEDILNIKKDALYTINNKVVAGSSGTIPESARYLDTSSSVEVKYENIFVTLVFNMADFMDKRTITLNNNTSITPYSVKTQDNKTYVSFMISSLNDEIHISGKSTKDMDDGFTIVFDSSTLVEDTSGGKNDSSSSTTTDDDDDDLDNGTYTIKNKVLKEDSDSESHAREYVDKESVITVKNNKMYLTLKFINASVIDDVSVKVEGSKTSYSTVKKTSDKLYIKFRIESLSDEILITTDLDLSDYGITNHDGLAFRVLLRSSTLEEDDDADNYDDEDDDDDTEDDDETVKDTVVGDAIVEDSQSDLMNAPAVGTNDQYKKVTYKVNNDIVTESSFGYQAARGAVNQVSYYEIIDDKKYITLGFTQTNIMNNIRLSIDGKKINYDIVSQDDNKNTLQIRFEVPSISTQVTVATNVTAMGRDISFGVKFLESTLELISTEEAENLSDLVGGSSGDTLNSLSNSSSGNVTSKNNSVFSSNNSNEGEVVVDEEAVVELASLAKEYFKKYTISNEVISDSTIGRSMARKYLNQTSIIEEIDGQFYATITFSGASSMGDFRIEVNGQTVEHTVPLNDMANNLVSLRFPINSVNDDIRAYMYIAPMRMTIDFGIKFLEESMILIEEGTVGEEVNTESSSLVDTLSNINESSKNNKEQVSAVKIAASTSVMVIVLNQVLSGLGGVFRRVNIKSILGNTINKE